MKKNILLGVCLCVVGGLLASCSISSSTMDETSLSSTKTNTTISSLPTTDRAGETIVIPENLTKIVSLVPSVTQVLEDLGKSQKLIGIDNQSQLKNTKQEVTQFDMMAIDQETLLALEAQVVFVSDINLYADTEIWDKLKKAGVTIINIPTSDTLEAIEEDVQFIADCVGQHEQGATLVQKMQADIEQLKTMGESIKQKKTVSFEVAALPGIYSFGKDVFLDDMLVTIGAKNVYHDQTGWLAITEESAIERNPDVIFTNVTYIDDPVTEILSRKGWSEVTAVKDKAIYPIDNAASSIPNHHVVEAMKEMAKTLYPEEFAKLTFSHD
ncbi:ABC transporter substrate-binding protein [Vagococcus zengguangii]|uniref:ABC transporter substrate-binding protein n=1 Tax=Vagococcus zengguangii TaxID=2571750 RepID=A0A4D7CU23_9ENTE|nr:ABC transporter substrate-binding protein [Vagococcus zengguangii]QCI85776.1 ABC transporter substrate-binding protein [Vagococcus zengguangii]TLG81717.1 ABC transporter substrate-binding protein [Vagococcus zengguangii]